VNQCNNLGNCAHNVRCLAMSKTIAIFVAAAVSAVAALPYTVASAAPAGGAFAIKNAAPIAVENARWGGGWHGRGWRGGGWRGGGWGGGGWGWGVGGGLLPGRSSGGRSRTPYYGGLLRADPPWTGIDRMPGYLRRTRGGDGHGIPYATSRTIQIPTVYGQRWLVTDPCP
jgi:hypothetical protein